MLRQILLLLWIFCLLAGGVGWLVGAFSDSSVTLLPLKASLIGSVACFFIAVLCFVVAGFVLKDFRKTLSQPRS